MAFNLYSLKQVSIIFAASVSSSQLPKWQHQPLHNKYEHHHHMSNETDAYELHQLQSKTIIESPRIERLLGRGYYDYQPKRVKGRNGKITNYSGGGKSFKGAKNKPLKGWKQGKAKKSVKKANKSRKSSKLNYYEGYYGYNYGYYGDYYHYHYGKANKKGKQTKKQTKLKKGKGNKNNKNNKNSKSIKCKTSSPHPPTSSGKGADKPSIVTSSPTKSSLKNPTPSPTKLTTKKPSRTESKAPSPTSKDSGDPKPTKSSKSAPTLPPVKSPKSKQTTSPTKTKSSKSNPSFPPTKKPKSKDSGDPKPTKGPKSAPTLSPLPAKSPKSKQTTSPTKTKSSKSDPSLPPTKNPKSKDSGDPKPTKSPKSAPTLSPAKSPKSEHTPSPTKNKTPKSDPSLPPTKNPKSKDSGDPKPTKGPKSAPTLSPVKNPKSEHTPSPTKNKTPKSDPSLIPTKSPKSTDSGGSKPSKGPKNPDSSLPPTKSPKVKSPNKSPSKSELPPTGKKENALEFTSDGFKCQEGVGDPTTAKTVNFVFYYVVYLKTEDKDDTQKDLVDRVKELTNEMITFVSDELLDCSYSLDRLLYEKTLHGQQRMLQFTRFGIGDTNNFSADHCKGNECLLSGDITATIHEEDSTSATCSIVKKVKEFMNEYNNKSKDKHFEAIQFVESDNDEQCPEYDSSQVSSQKVELSSTFSQQSKLAVGIFAGLFVFFSVTFCVLYKREKNNISHRNNWNDDTNSKDSSIYKVLQRSIMSSCSTNGEIYTPLAESPKPNSSSSSTKPIS